MTPAVKWEIIVSKYRENLDEQESVIEATWEKIFAELFGYSILMGEIKRQYNVSVAHTNVRVDMVVGDNFVVEIKRHKDIFGEVEKKQLNDYMKLLSLKIGVLIGDRIYIRANDYSFEIPFIAENRSAIGFIQSFNKYNFDTYNVASWISHEKQFLEDVETIKQEATPDLIKDLLKKHFSERFNTLEIEEALKASITQAKEVTTRTVVISSRVIQNNYSRLKKARAIQICIEGGMKFDDKGIRFANKLNSGNYHFDPSKKQLETEGFWLLLSDEKNKLIHVFDVDGGIIPANDEWLNTNENLYKLRVNGESNDFTERKSDISLTQFHVKTIGY
ncbi:MAG: GxxExxY protein [Defluviitaleaceae bacterium]|nr:GxxExxY protein [Defluviitaleaceae bacterium]